jgi:hypothetical protein
MLSAPCSDENKALFAAHQLRGTARIWWDHYHAMQPAGHVITWGKFRAAFRVHHIPEGLIERKLNEFLNLTQGTHTVMQYAQVFSASTRVIMRILTPAREIAFMRPEHKT